MHPYLCLQSDYDDVLLYSHINSVVGCIAIALQQELDSLVQWLHSWLIPQKCEFLSVTNKNPVMYNNIYYYVEKCLIHEVYLIPNTTELQLITKTQTILE